MSESDLWTITIWLGVFAAAFGGGSILLSWLSAKRFDEQYGKHTKAGRKNIHRHA
ncbi:hypothetical protein ACUSIJ_13390 [Pseudochelatococcus sp. B33]